MFSGVVMLGLSGALFLSTVFGLRTGRKTALWTSVLALSGAGLTTGALLAQDDPGLASWLVAPPIGAALGVANVRALFEPGGRFRT